MYERLLVAAAGPLAVGGAALEDRESIAHDGLVPRTDPVLGGLAVDGLLDRTWLVLLIPGSAPSKQASAGKRIHNQLTCQTPVVVEKSSRA